MGESTSADEAEKAASVVAAGAVNKTTNEAFIVNDDYRNDDKQV